LPVIRFRRTEGFRGFTGSFSLRPVELLVSLADLTGVFPSQRRLLPPSFPTGRSPFPQSDITTVATEQTPPMGLSPIGTSASIAAQAPSPRWSYPASSVLRASPPSHTVRPVSRELPVDPHRDHRWDFPCCAWSPLPTCRRQYPGRSDGSLFAHTFHPLRPSPKPGRVGSCITIFGACSAFTYVTACMLARSPSRPSAPEASAVSLPPCCSDCYRVERTSSRAGLPPLWTSAFTAHPVGPSPAQGRLRGRRRLKRSPS